MNISMDDGYDPQTDDAETVAVEQAGTDEGMLQSVAEDSNKDTNIA